MKLDLMLRVMDHGKLCLKPTAETQLLKLRKQTLRADVVLIFVLVLVSLVRIDYVFYTLVVGVNMTSEITLFCLVYWFDCTVLVAANIRFLICRACGTASVHTCHSCSCLCGFWLDSLLIDCIVTLVLATINPCWRVFGLINCSWAYQINSIYFHTPTRAAT